ncbi:hypothetical protein GCM10020256_63450 [Streptomyces thermocoprophilus]
MIVLLSVGPGTLESTMTEDLSPAERYAAARRRAAEQATALASFREMYDFGLDPFQIEACQALEAGKGVLVAAPTGSGKTIVGEFAVHLALRQGKKCFYTTPIKALSNQKYADLCRRYGTEKVGLLTGDNSVNSDAPVVVMTTEVLRNMLYAGSQTLLGLGYVVMDEVHYLSDRFRGAVWEEVIIHLPESVTLVSLSATVSNAEEFGDWLDTVRGDTEVIVSEHRPVPLFQHVLAGRRMYDLFEEGEGHRRAVNPDLTRLARMESTRPSYQDRRRGRAMREADRERERRQRSRTWTPGRPEVIERLDAEGLLPAITFIFSRAGCEAAVQQCLYAGLRLNDDTAREQVRALVEERTAAIPREDLHVLGYYEWLEGLERGIAAHHAGMLPTFKEVVEELFVRGLVKAVFATETLALGINMPARSVVLEKLVKWNGEQHADITPRRVHPAHRARRPARHRRRGPRRGAVAARHEPRAPRGPRRHPHLSAALQLQAVVQHGGQPGRAVRPAPLAGAAGDVLRAVPGRQIRRRHLPAGAAQRGGPRRLQGVHDLPPRRLRGVRAAAPRTEGPRDRAGPSRRRPAARGKPRSRWNASNRATSSTCPPANTRGSPWSSTPVCPPAAPTTTAASTTTTGPARWCSPPNGRSSGSRRSTSPCRSNRWSGCAFRSPSTRAPRSPAAISRRRCAPRPGTSRPSGTANGVPRRPTTGRSPACARPCAPTPATVAATVRTTPAGPSATTGCCATPASWSAVSKDAPTPSRAPSTGSWRS